MCQYISLMITIGLTIFDMGSDIALAIDYSQTGDDWWFALTLTFFPSSCNRVAYSFMSFRCCQQIK